MLFEPRNSSARSPQTVMDVFGLPAVKETRAMDAARFRNKTQQRMLHEKVDRLEAKRKTSAGKMTAQKSDVQRFLSNIPPSNVRCVVCPFGLTDRERAIYRQMRRGFSPSMTLEEFDSKMAQLRRQRQTLRRERPTPGGDAQEDGSQIVDVGKYSFCATISKHKMTMREAFERAVSDDVKYVSGDKTPASSTPRKGFFGHVGSSSSEGLGDLSGKEAELTQKKPKVSTAGASTPLRPKGVPADKTEFPLSFSVNGVSMKRTEKNLPSLASGVGKTSR